MVFLFLRHGQCLPQLTAHLTQDNPLSLGDMTSSYGHIQGILCYWYSYAAISNMLTMVNDE